MSNDIGGAHALAMIRELRGLVIELHAKADRIEIGLSHVADRAARSEIRIEGCEAQIDELAAGLTAAAR